MNLYLLEMKNKYLKRENEIIWRDYTLYIL